MKVKVIENSSAKELEVHLQSFIIITEDQGKNEIDIKRIETYTRTTNIVGVIIFYQVINRKDLVDREKRLT